MTKPLTTRELQVLRALADGRVRKNAGDELGVSESRVKDLLMTARLKLGASTSAQAVHLATRMGLL